MCRACRAHGEIKMRTKFWLGSPKGKQHWKDVVVDGRKILKWIVGKQSQRVQTTNLAKYVGRCAALVNRADNILPY
jgi:hypothetical protein